MVSALIPDSGCKCSHQNWKSFSENFGPSFGFQIGKLVLRKRWYLLHPDSVFDDFGLVGITTTSPTLLCIEKLFSTHRERTQRWKVWPIYKRHTGKTSKLENAIKDAYKFCFRWTWACCKAGNKLKNLSQRNTKKKQELWSAKHAKDWAP